MVNRFSQLQGEEYWLHNELPPCEAWKLPDRIVRRRKKNVGAERNKVLMLSKACWDEAEERGLWVLWLILWSLPESVLLNKGRSSIILGFAAPSCLFWLWNTKHSNLRPNPTCWNAHWVFSCSFPWTAGILQSTRTPTTLCTSINRSYVLTCGKVLTKQPLCIYLIMSSHFWHLKVQSHVKSTSFSFISCSNIIAS